MPAYDSILHIDDDEEMLRFVASVLGKLGYEVQSLSDPVKAIDSLISTKARLVILDIDMPEVDGMTVLKQIKAYDGRILVIMLSGVVTMSMALEAMELGAEACVFKPLHSIEPLQSAVEAALLKIETWKQAIRELERRRSVERSMT